MHSVNGPRLTYNEPWRHFSEEDCVLFEEGIRKHNKNFFLIQRNKASFFRFQIILGICFVCFTLPTWYTV